MVGSARWSLRSGIARTPFLRTTLLPVVREYHRARWALRQLRKPLHRNPPLNGQARRRECIEALLAALRPEEVLETGTFRGSTTLYLAKVQSAPVHSVEMDKYFWLASSLRCLPTRQVRVRFGDSLEFLHERAAGGGGNRLTFFYLDAHWGERLPLADEVAFILRTWREALLCIDDFRVDDDPGYRFDSYQGIALSLDYLAPVLPEGLAVFAPAARSETETGARSGSVYIAVGSQATNRVSRCVPAFLRPVSIGRLHPPTER